MKISFHAGVSDKICPALTKLLLIMKLTALIMLIACLHVSARGFSQKMNFRGRDVSLPDVFSAIKQQTGYVVFYNVDDLNGLKPVTLDVKNISLTDLLETCLKDQPLGYTIQNKTVFISRIHLAAPDKGVLPMAPADVHGRVTDSAGNPLAGASVAVKGTKRVVSTNDKGEFTLAGLDGRSMLVVSYIGYSTRETRVSGKELSGLEIVLRHNNNPLDEVQVIGYGTNTRRFSIGSSTTVTAEEIAQQPVNNILLTLQGRVPGLVVTPNGGAPGASARIQIRGQNTLQSSLDNNVWAYDQPLFIIDGIPFAPQNNKINLTSRLGADAAVTFSNTSSAADGMSPFNSINPADIESITVLKDADATSIYGSQGSNGVILITTKKGKPGKTSLGINVDRSVNAVARPLQMLNTQQYLDLRREAINNDQVPASMINSSLFPDLTVFGQNKYTNWYHQFFGRTSSNTNAHATLTGGSNTTSFIFTAGYSNSEYNFPGNFADNRYTLHSAIHHSALNDRFTLDFGTDYSYDNNNSSGNPNVGSAYVSPPNLPDLLDSTGNLVWNYRGVDLSSWQQYAYLKQTSDLQSYNLNTVLNAGYKIAKGLRISANMGYSRFTTEETGQQPLSSQSPQYYNESSATFGSSAYQTLSIEPQLDYRLNTRKGAFTALLGASYKKNLSDNVLTTGMGYSNDALLGSINGASQIMSSDNSSIYKYEAAFGRLNYIYDQKYIVNLTGRRDGSSNFGVDRQFGNFGSAGLGWIFSEEKGFKTALPFFSYAKLSGDYGTSGGDGISPYQYQAFWQPNTNVNTFQGIRPYNPVNLYNPDYSWSMKKTWNIGLDLGVFDNRILLNATWYQSRTDNQLTKYALPAQTGFSSVLENFDATVQNTGLEFTLSSNNIKSRNFNWTTNFNLSVNRNKLLAFPGLESSPYAFYYVIGKSVNIVNGYKYRDVNPTTGLFEFYDAKGEVTGAPAYGVASQGGDMAPIADLQPKFTGGFSNSFRYKNITLTVFFQFAKQTSLNYLSDIYGGQGGQYIPGGLTNVPVQALNHWKNPGDVSKLEKASTGYEYDASDAAYNFIESSGAYSDASYIRLKTLSLEYQFPDTYLKKAGMKNLRIFIHAQNLLTITKYEVGDPESAGSLYIFPLQRTVAGGLSFNF
jgi:TonB-linked SusC/RagA family outer membrane protein